MGRKLKDYYDAEYIDDLAGQFSEVMSNFDVEAYHDEIPKDYNELTFLNRQDVIANAIKAGLKGKYSENLAIFRLIWGEELQQETGMFKEGWWLWPLGRYVEKHALEDIGATISFVQDFTKRHTGEYIVRPILINHTKYMMDTFLKWSQDENVHIRRLSSEGFRISLPWAVKTTAALNEPELYKKILTNLKEDRSKFVQKSVGNNLNDLYKVNPQFADEIIEEWKKNPLSKNTTWIIKHARRNQNKSNT
ncbi:MAG: DNA alkylation repair protein [Candidatus Moranbacteria bacterium]|nr:DNA alkylation repair protein [Candidatus Moranbacteria bacterium]